MSLKVLLQQQVYLLVFLYLYPLNCALLLPLLLFYHSFFTPSMYIQFILLIHTYHIILYLFYLNKCLCKNIKKIPLKIISFNLYNFKEVFYLYTIFVPLQFLSCLYLVLHFFFLYVHLLHQFLQ